MSQFGCLQGVDSRQDVCVPVDRVDAIALTGRDEGKVDGYGLRTLVGPCEQAVFSNKHPAFDCAFALVVVDRDLGIFEKSGESNPVFQCVVNGFHQVMAGIEGRLCLNDCLAKGLHQRFGFPSANSQPDRVRFVFYLGFDAVQVPVDIEHCIADIRFEKFRLEVFASRMGAAAGLGPVSVCEQCVEAASGVSLNDAGKFSEKREIALEGQVGREIEYGWLGLGIADIRGHFGLADIVFVLAVLDLDGRIVCLDDGGLEQLFHIEFVQQRESFGCGLHPAALGRAGNRHILASEDLLLPIVRESIVELADDYLCEQPGTGVATGDGGTRLLCRDYVLLALRAGARFLAMLEDFQCGAYHLELMSKQVGDELCLYIAVWANRIFRANMMLLRLMWQTLCVLQDAFGAGKFLRRWRLRWLTWSWLGRTAGRARIMPLCLLSILPLPLLLGLGDQHVQLFLQVLEDLLLLLVAFERLFELLLKILYKGSKALNLDPRVRVLLL